MGLMPTPGEGAGGGPTLPTLPIPVSTGSGGCSCGCVSSALQSVVQYVGQVQNWLQGWDQANQTGQQSTLSKIFGAIVSFVQYIAHSWLGQIIKSIWNILKTIFQAIQKEMAYIIKLFKQYEQMVRYYEQKILGPIINIIQALRKTLVIFKLFHLKFATQLDNYLSGIEGRLTNIFLFYQRELNYIIDWMNLIVDPFGLISEGMFIGSAIRSIGAVWAGVMGYPQSGSTTALNTTSSTQANFYTESSTKSYLNGLSTGGTNADDQAIIEAQRQGYAELGYGT